MINKNFKILLKSIGASAMITLGVEVLLVNPTVGPFLFSLGLLAVCYLDLYLFTGKCGYIITDKQIKKEIILILIGNIIGAILFGGTATDSTLSELARAKVANWDVLHSLPKSYLCGVVMFIAVHIYKTNKSPLGILLGVPLFIICGFQHCIANMILMVMGLTFNPIIIIHIIGNLFGALTISLFINPETILT